MSKADEGPGGGLLGIGSGGASPVAPQMGPRGVQSSLRVTVPTELTGSAYIFVCIKKGGFDDCWYFIKIYLIKLYCTYCWYRIMYCQFSLLG